MIALPPSRRRRLATVAESNLQLVGAFEQLYARTLIEMTRAGLLDDDLVIALDHATAAVELASRHVGELACPALAILAYLQYLRGDDVSARTTAGRALDHPEAPRSPLGVGFAESLLALLECEAGHPLTAEARARDAARQANELGLADAWSSALTHHALGQALLALGRPKDAERELERAELLRRAPEPRLDHVHSLLALAAVHTARGRLTLARAELDAAGEKLDAFADVGRLASLAAEGERALDEARSGAERAVEPPTLTELSILRLLATDLSQREIGDELFVSLNTVKTHTRNVYAKLGVNSRQAAVRQANLLGLLETDDSPG
jgi:LuxR family maltose regulon positive regulatory protein